MRRVMLAFESPPELTGEEGLLTATAYAETEAVPKASLAITKTVDKATYNAAGIPLNYTVTVVNTGNVTLENAALTDLVNKTVPVAMTKMGDTDDDGDIDVGETWIYTGTYMTTQADLDGNVALVNVAEITTDQIKTTTDSAETTAVQPQVRRIPDPEPGLANMNGNVADCFE